MDLIKVMLTPNIETEYISDNPHNMLGGVHLNHFTGNYIVSSDNFDTSYDFVDGLTTLDEFAQVMAKSYVLVMYNSETLIYTAQYDDSDDIQFLVPVHTYWYKEDRDVKVATPYTWDNARLSSS